MMAVNLGCFFILNSQQIFGNGLNPHIGLLFVSGLLFGPYGSIGAVLGVTASDFIKGYPIDTLTLRFIVSFGVSYLSFKLWYSKFNDGDIYPPRLVDSANLAKFLGIILITGLIYSISMDGLLRIMRPDLVAIIGNVDIKYFLNYINFSAIFGIIGIWIARKLDCFHIPEISSKPPHNQFYRIVCILLICLAIIFAVDGYIIEESQIIITFLFVLLLAIVFIYLTKPVTSRIVTPDTTTHERIMDVFLLVTLIIILAAIAYINFTTESWYFNPVNNEFVWELLLAADVILLIFFIPSGVVLSYIERKLIDPIVSFSRIDGVIHEGERINTEELLDVYSPYTDEDSEVGKLARSYTNLITYNNHYIENIDKIEREQERIKTELDIAKRIQKSSLPTEAIEDEDCHAYGFSQPAKEVGGDFYDYFEIDNDNLAIVIGDASGKGVPAALLTTTTQTLIRDRFYNQKDPAEVLTGVNDTLCQNNSENMFITLWLGVYNRKTNVLAFANAGHNPPIIENGGEVEFLEVDAGIVLGILEDYSFVTQKMNLEGRIILYTDGITDAVNERGEAYGEERLVECLKNSAGENMIDAILDDVNGFAKDVEQFDDMTIMILENKK